MGRTFAEKVLARAAGERAAAAGDILEVEPDLVLSHDNTAAIIRIFAQLGDRRVRHPARLVFTLDHAAPPPTTRHAENHAETRRFAAAQGVRLFDVGRGICHQVIAEEGLVRPGVVVLGADSHTPHAGALGAFGAGVGRSEVAALWATGRLWLKVPHSIRITFTGAVAPWVTTKDVALHLIGALGADRGNYASVELDGDGVAAWSQESRFVLPNMMAEMGVKNAWMPPDEVTFAWLADRDAAAGREARAGEDRAAAAALMPDAGAQYAETHRVTLDPIEPQVACPDQVDHTAPVSAVAGTPIQQAFLGTCTNGRLEDLEAAAQVVKGRRVAPGTRFLVIPASSEVLEAAIRSGALSTLLAAGATLGTPGCGPCMGNHLGVPATGEVTISTANRNFRGRMGTRDAPIYLASPAVVAASAIAGEIAHPATIAGTEAP